MNSEEDSDYTIKLDSKEPLIPEGRYRFKFIEYRTNNTYKGQGKLALKFSVFDSGPYRGIELERHYNVQLVGRSGLRGRFKPPKRGSFLIEYYRLFSDRVPSRRDRLSMSPYSHYVIEATVRTVTCNSQQQALPSQMRYSVIGELLKVNPDLIP